MSRSYIPWAAVMDAEEAHKLGEELIGLAQQSQGQKIIYHFEMAEEDCDCQFVGEFHLDDRECVVCKATKRAEAGEDYDRVLEELVAESDKSA
jgi:hypothetical protein